MNDRRKIFELFEENKDIIDERISLGIEKYRKGNCTVKLTDGMGNPLAGTGSGSIGTSSITTCSMTRIAANTSSPLSFRNQHFRRLLPEVSCFLFTTLSGDTIMGQNKEGCV